MVKTHLPGHLDSVRLKTKPKHQLLILKCYPRLPKNSTADVRPNSSELSYLIFYASTRQSKLQKVGLFLEQKTASDVYKQQSTRVHVTLQILQALLEEKSIGSGTGFALIAPYVLRIIGEILQNTTDVSLIEASVDLWTIVCEHQDEATLAADHHFRGLYEGVVRQYASLAHKDRANKMGKSTQPVGTPDDIRLREAGLNALKAVLSADALASEAGRQLGVTIPAVISNIQGSSATHLEHLQRESIRGEEEKKREAAMNHRPSIAARPSIASRPTGISIETNPKAAEGTASDADDYAEEEAAILALDCLRAVFSADQRVQVRSATAAVLSYIGDRGSNARSRPSTAEKQAAALQRDDWATKLIEMTTAWTPVQDRFVLLVTITETLVRLPLTREGDLPQHILFATMISETLRSDLNMIGLSVMDVMLNLLRHIIRVLQLNLVGGDSRSGEKPPSTAAPGTTARTYNLANNRSPSERQQQLLETLERCIADLAIHIYYTDQVSDMIAQILARLRATAAHQGSLSTLNGSGKPSSVIADAEKSGSSTPSRGRGATTGQASPFTMDAARIIALDAVKDVLITANNPEIREPSAEEETTKHESEGRTRTPIDVWVGTEYLFDESMSPQVRTAYSQSITTWAKVEARKQDWGIEQCIEAVRTCQAPTLAPQKSLSRKSRRSPSNAALASQPQRADHRKMLRVADHSPGRSSYGRSGSSNAPAHRMPKVEDLKRVLNGETPLSRNSSFANASFAQRGRRSVDDADTASESIMDVGDIDLGSDTSGSSAAKKPRRPLKDILASIRVDDENVRTVTVVTQPPY